MNEKVCRSCVILKTQLEQQRINHEAAVAKYLSIIQTQSELMQDISASRNVRKNYDYQSSYNSPTTDLIDLNKRNRGSFRAFIGSITSEIDKDSLKKCLEESFGEVVSIDIISSKACAFADFASSTAYHNAVSEGAVLVNGIALSVERVRRPKPRK